jgi:hypothetical protein
MAACHAVRLSIEDLLMLTPEIYTIVFKPLQHLENLGKGNAAQQYVCLRLQWQFIDDQPGKHD